MKIKVIKLESFVINIPFFIPIIYLIDYVFDIKIAGKLKENNI